MTLRPSPLALPKKERRRPGRQIYLIAFFMAVQFGTVFYSSSTFLAQFISENNVGIIFSAGAFLASFAILSTPLLLQYIKNYTLLQSLLWTNAVLLLIIAYSGQIELVLISFFIFLITARIIPLSMDFFLEDSSEDKTTGNTRGLYLTAINLGLLIAPLLLGLILANDEYWKVFLLAAIATIPISIFARFNYKNQSNPEPDPLNLKSAIRSLAKRPEILRIGISSMLLFTFYSWMLIYTPIYLNRYIGFGWEEMGLIFTIMLLPFVFLEIPLGRIADGYLGEKELLMAGFAIMGLSVGVMSIFVSPSFWLWAGILFCTRIGASMVEIMNETYFFKQISGRDTHMISIYRLSKPLGYLIAPLLASLALIVIDIRFTFAILGFIMLIGILHVYKLKDTL